MPNPNKPPNDTITSGEEANPPNEPRNLSNVLPAGVEELRQGRILTSQSSAVVAALFASIEATIITANDTSIGRPVLTNVELVLAYFVLFTSASTTFTSLFLIDRLGGSLPFDRITKPEAEITPSALKTGRKILARYGAGGPQWDTLEFHYFATLILSGLAFYVQIIVHLFCYQVKVVAIPSAVLASFTFYPIFSLFTLVAKPFP